MSQRKHPEREADAQRLPTQEIRDAVQDVIPGSLRSPRLFIAGPDGCFDDGDERWISFRAACDRGEISGETLRQHLLSNGFTTRFARTAEGAVARFCRLADIECFLSVTIRAGEDGLLVDGERRLAAIGTWAESFGVSPAVLKKYVEQAGLQPTFCRDRMGRILPFYEEQDIRTAATPLLEELPRADATGFFTLEGVRYGTFRAWSRALGIAKHVIARRVETLGLTGRDGRDAKGKRWIFFPEEDVRRACTELLEDLPYAEPNGFFEREGVRYGSIGAWARELGSNAHTVKARLTAAVCPSIHGRDAARKVVSFFAEPDVRRACVDLVTEFPRADQAGFFILDEERYGTVFAWTKELGIGQRAVEVRIESAALSSIIGIDVGGNRQPFYAEKLVRAACADLLQDLPRSSQSMFERDGVRVGLVRRWSRELGISSLAIQRRLDAIGATPVPAYFRGRLEQFYEEAAVRRACGELLEELPTTDDRGFAEINAIRYGSLYVWSQELGVVAQTIMKGLQAAGIAPLRAKSSIGVVRDIYAEQDVRASVRELLDARSPNVLVQRRENLYVYLARVAREHVAGTPYSVSSSGFLRCGSSYFGTKQAWLRALSANKLSPHIRKLPWSEHMPSVAGRTPDGILVELYRDTDIEVYPHGDDHDLIADASGFAIIEGEEWGSTKPLATRLGLHPLTVKKHIKAAGLTPRSGRISVGRPGVFYKLEDVRLACADLLGVELTLDEDGFMMKDGERWGTTNAWVEELIPGTSMNLRPQMLAAGAKPLQARAHTGLPVDVFREADVRKVLEAYLALPVLDEQGVVMIDERPHALIPTLAERLKLPLHIIIRDTKAAALAGREARKDGYGPVTVYDETEVRRICASRLLDTPTIDASGIVVVEGVKCAAVETIGRLLGLNKRTIRLRLDAAGEMPHDARKASRALQVYSIEAAKRLCADLLIDCPVADEQNIIMRDKIRHAPATTWQVLKGRHVKRLLRNDTSLPTFKGKLLDGHMREFYSEADVDRLIAAMSKRRS